MDPTTRNDLLGEDAVKVRYAWEASTLLLTIGLVASELLILRVFQRFDTLMECLTAGAIVLTAFVGFMFGYVYIIKWFMHIAPKVPIFVGSQDHTLEMDRFAGIDTVELQQLNDCIRDDLVKFMLMNAFEAVLLFLPIFPLIFLNMLLVPAVCAFVGTALAKMPAPDGPLSCEYWIEVCSMGSSYEARSNIVADAKELLWHLRQDGAPTRHKYRHTAVHMYRIVIENLRDQESEVSRMLRGTIDLSGVRPLLTAYQISRKIPLWIREVRSSR